MMLEYVCGRGKERNQMGELCTELSHAGFVDQEEKVGLSLLGETSSVKSELQWIDGRILSPCPGLDSQYITLDIVEIQRWGRGGSHVKG